MDAATQQWSYFATRLHLASSWPGWPWLSLWKCELQSLWSAEKLSPIPTEGNQLAFAFWNYLLLLLAQRCFPCPASQHPDISIHSCTVALTSLISCLFEKVSLTTSESKIKTLNYTYPKWWQSRLIWAQSSEGLNRWIFVGCYHIQFSKGESFHLVGPFATILLCKNPAKSQSNVNSTFLCLATHVRIIAAVLQLNFWTYWQCPWHWCNCNNSSKEVPWLGNLLLGAVGVTSFPCLSLQTSRSRSPNVMSESIPGADILNFARGPNPNGSFRLPWLISLWWIPVTSNWVSLLYGT